MGTKQVKAFGTEAAVKPLGDIVIDRRESIPYDVKIEILYCGI